jgi:hypothetical protein
MAKRKSLNRPTSIRLTPDHESVILLWSKATGWSVSKCLSHALAIAIGHQTSDKAAITKAVRAFEVAAKLQKLNIDTAAKAKAIRAEGQGVK